MYVLYIVLKYKDGILENGQKNKKKIAFKHLA